MKIQSPLLKATMFAAILLGASVTTQNAKADDTTSDSNDKTATTATTVKPQQPYDGFSEDTDATTSKATSTQAVAQQASANQTATNDVSSAVTTSTNQSTNQFKAQNDYYDYINHTWLNSSDIKYAKVDKSVIIDTQNSVTNAVYNKFMNYVNGTESTTDPNMQKAVDYYKLLINQNYSTPQDFVKTGVAPIMTEVNEIDGIEDIYALNDKMKDLLEKGVTLPFGVKVDIDQNNPQLRALYFYGGAPLLLTSSGSLDNYNENSQNTIAQFLTSAGLSFDSIGNIIANTKKFDQILVKYQSQSDIENNLYQVNYTGEGIHRVTNYLPVNFTNFNEASAYLDMDQFVNDVTGQTPGYIFEMSPSFYSNINEIINPDNFTMIKSWMISNYILEMASKLSNLGTDFTTVKDETPAQFQQRFAYYVTEKTFANEFSKYFGDVLLPQETKSAVTDMAKNMVSAYETTISNSSWLSDTTKAAAIDKLNNLKINVGYPTDSYSYYNGISVDPKNGNPYDIYQQAYIGNKYVPFTNYLKPVDRTEWGNLSSLLTNAQYSPYRNAIYISTGIIQSPFFDINQTDSKNYGGLGTIIGHELSHAFDGTGSLFDSNGLFNDWWTASDYETYDSKRNQLIQDYNGLQFEGATLKGENVVDEALADNAGLRVDELALQQLGGANWSEFFTNYAMINRHHYYLPENQSDQNKFIDFFENTDPHAPFPIRIDVTLKNNDQFADAYNVKQGDGMYIAPADRFDLWK